MAESTKQKERLKLALIPVLAICLITVLMGDDAKQPSPVPELIQPAKRSAVKSSVTESSGEQQSDRDVEWPSLSLTTIMAHNPFELKDPRAMLDAEMLADGITGDAQMTEVSAADFFLPESATDIEVNASFPAALSEQARSGPGEDGNGKSEQSGDTTTPLPEAAPDVPDAEQLAIAELERQRIREEERAVLDLQQRLTSLQNLPVTMFMTSVRGNSVLLGDRMIREGELVEAGIRVASINRQGITFELVEPPVAATDVESHLYDPSND